MEVAYLALSAVQAVGAIQQGKAQKRMYDLKARQAELSGRRDALNYSKQGVEVLERQRKLASTIFARAGAGGVDPFSGSSMTVSQYNAFKAGEEYNLGIENADMAIAGGLAQSQSLQAAGKQAMKSAYMGAIASIAGGISGYSKLATPAAAAGAGLSSAPQVMGSSFGTNVGSFA